MSKKNNKRGHKPKKSPANKTTASKPSLFNRRNTIKALIALPFAGFAGAAIHRYDVKNKELHDLSAVGQGAPVIVQVHDPSCQLCRELMANTKKALETRDDIVYRIADLTSSKGADFGREYKAQKTTLLLFNKAGKQVDKVQGVASVSNLEQRFSAL